MTGGPTGFIDPGTGRAIHYGEAMAQQPGWYHADGDPDGTVRYWDGEEWIGQPTDESDIGPIDAERNLPVFGGVLDRLAARLIDSLVVALLASVSSVLFGGPFIPNPTDTGPILAGAVAAFAYEVIPVAMTGKTLGKRVMKLAVTNETFDSPPGWVPAGLRGATALVRLIPFSGNLIGVVLNVASGVGIFTDERNRSVEDRLGSTYVIKTGWRSADSDQIEDEQL